jgi:hypothetical protein
VRIFGALSGTTMNAATPGSVIIAQQTQMFGTANAAIASGTLTMNLAQVDFRAENLFTWADSGTSPPTPATFTANVGTLGNALSIAGGTPVEVDGFVAPIGDGNQDMTANALADLTTAPSLVYVKNLTGGFTVGATTSSTQIQLAISGTAATGELAIVDQGFVGTMSLPTTPAPTVQPASSGGLFMIRDKITGSVTAFTSFSAFASALGNALTQGATLEVFGALGTYNAGTNVTQAALVCVVLH